MATTVRTMRKADFVSSCQQNGPTGTRGSGKHEVTVVSASPDPAHVTMPRVHNIAALLKRWLLGTHQGGVQHVHLDYYLDEFAFRFNSSWTAVVSFSFSACV